VLTGIELCPYQTVTAGMSYPMGQHAPPPQGAQGQWGQAGGQGQAGYMQYGQPPPPPSQHYGSYGQQFQQNAFQVNAWQAFGFQSGNDLQGLFEHYKSQAHQAIQAEELSRILNDSPNIRNYYKITWSIELCKIMISMLDRSKDGLMQWQEFNELLQCLTYWYQCFCQYDTDRSGFIEAHELGRVIREKFGYQLSQNALTTLLKRYSRAMDDGRCLIAFDDFVSLSVRLRAYTEAFRARDRQMNGGTETGHCTFGYDDFLQCVMCL
jgi:hypothetical protein